MLKLVMLGDSLNHHGGIVTVQKLIIQGTCNQVDIQHIPTHEDGSKIHRIIIFQKSLGKLFWRLITKKNDLIHIHLADWGSVLRKTIIVLMALSFRKPILIHAHGPEFHLTYKSLPKWAQKFLRWIFRKCHGFIVLSKSWQDFYVNHLGLESDRVVVMPNPVVFPAEIPERIHVNKVRFVFIGRVGQRKGTFDLIRAFAALSQEEKFRSELIIAGDGDIKEGLDLVKSLNLVDRITFLGWINSEQRNDLLKKADIFVLPSYNEALPMALLEAMSWELPVITTAVGGIPDLITANSNGLLINPGNIKQLSEAMQSLIENEAFRLFLGKSARKSLVNYDVQSYCDRLIEIYYSVSTKTIQHKKIS